MTIVPMKKVAFVGATSDKGQALEALQELGCVHLEPWQASEAAPDLPSAAGKQARQALRYLLGARLKRRQLEYEDDFDVMDVTGKALANRRRKLEVQEHIDALRDRIRYVEPWGEFTLPPIEHLANHRLWFYVVPHYQLRAIETGLPWEVVHRDSRHSYVVVVSREEPPQGSIPVPRSRLGVRSLGELRRTLSDAEAELEEVLAERWALTRFIKLMIRNLARAEDAAALTRASRNAFDGGEIFAVSGWAPAARADELAAYASEAGLAWTAEEPGPSDAPPILLDNPTALEPGEDLVTFYQIPGYGDWDPSPVVYVSFALFFGMIVADAAYGAVIGLLAVFFWKRMKRTASLRRARKLVALVGVSCIAYGVLVGSYFGVSPNSGSALARLHVLDVNDFDSMMKLSIGLGVLHLLIANAITAWGRRGHLTALAPVGWMLALAGGFAVYLGAGAAGGIVVVSGLAMVLLLSSARPVNKLTDVVWRGLDGLQALTGVSQAFGDVLSYLRLFALGLSSASLAVTFNQLGTDIMGAGQGIALLLGLMVLALGHGLNFVLGIVSGVVHGLRLNVIELYNWSVFGEGKPFAAFDKREAIVVAESQVGESGGGM